MDDWIVNDIFWIANVFKNKKVSKFSQGINIWQMLVFFLQMPSFPKVNPPYNNPINFPDKAYILKFVRKVSK